jgi:ribosomal protein S18 acetylase RimI-like enzyme
MDRKQKNMNRHIIKSLGPELLEDYLYFFDNANYTDKPDWTKCYCYSFHFTGEASEWNKEKNRAAVIGLIREGGMKGYLAYSDDKPVGWCNANDRNNFQRLLKYYDLVSKPGEKVCSIVCFLIHPDYRKKGISKAFLDMIAREYSSLNYDFLEAYPGKDRSSSAHYYKGNLNLYEKAGFFIEKELDNYCIVRKGL